ncbi:neurofilament heavy polypeptide-like isoform X4 [Penaeus chinensis]|uniref:neurofilament heavy polypeptide-like isoform X4 n=1 Tax=Penaeus chinensis TaxID=139456 RepID=UPI001FB64DB1|nr:neurofilament heavy polypeptide-like isoform X4 [Penaeus chinensis]
MSRSASVSVPRRELYVVPERRTSLELEDAPRLMHDQQREYDSWPCDSFFLLPDAVLTMDAGTFRADLMSLDPALSASLPDWDLPGLTGRSASPARESSHKPRSPHAHVAPRADRRSLTLLDHHEGLTVHTAGQGTVLIGGGGDGRDSSGGAGGSAPSANGHSGQQQQQQQDQQQNSAAASKKSPAKKGSSFSLVASDIDIGEGEPAPAQRERFLMAIDAPLGLPPVPPTRGRPSAPVDQDAYWFAQGDNPPPSKQQRASLAGPNDLIFGEDDKSSGLSYKDREERVRQLREKQQLEKQQKLEELKEQAAAAQKFREQQENERRRRLEDMRVRDADRRSQVEERKRIIQQAEQDRREAVLRKTAVREEREQRLESKRRNEKSNIVFAFGSSTPRMLDPKDGVSTFWGSRRATSTTNVHLADTNISRRASEGGDMDLSRKRATSAHSLDRKPEDLRMSSSMYEVFHWDDSSPTYQKHPPTTQGEDLMTRSMTAAIPASAARRRTDLMPAMPSLRDSSGSTRSSPRHRSPGRALSLGRLDELSRPRQRNPPLAPLHETTPSSVRMSQPARTMSKSMCHLGPRPARTQTGHALDITSGQLDRGVSRSSVTLAQPRMTRAEMLRQKKLRGVALTSSGDSSTSSTKSSSTTQGMRSGTVTPNSPSRPTSALSQGSNNSSQVSLRSRTSPRKPRPLSIAGSSLSSADKPRDAVPPSRESRPMERKLSVGSTSSTKPARAKSAGSDRSAPATPARTPVKATTPKKTPSQVKAENAAKKAVEKSKSTPKTKTTPKTTPLHSPAVESKPLPGSKEKRVSPQKEDKPAEQNNKETKQQLTENDATTEAKPDTADASQEAPVQAPVEEKQPEKVVEPTAKPTAEPTAEPIVNDTDAKLQPTEELTPAKPQETVAKEPENNETPKEKEKEGSQENLEKTEESEKTMIKKATDKPVTGYATEEDYKAALAEKRRQAREAKERELEMERQKQLAEEERERKEEQEYLKMLEDQRKAEEERLRKAIEEADRQREEDAKKKEEEEKQREENERVEQQKRLEAEEKLRREEEERQARKSRVAAIMARTRGKGGSNTPTKAEAKTPSDESKGFNESDMSSSMTDSMINALVSQSESSSQPQSDASSQPAQPSSDASSRPSQPDAVSENAVVAGVETDSKTPAVKSATPPRDVTSASMGVELTHSNIEVTRATENSMVDDLISGIASVKVEEPHVNGDSPVPMDTTPTQSVDLLGTISDVHSVNHNGVDNTPAQTSQGTDNLLGSLDPINSSNNTTAVTPAAANFEQIIDLGQTKLSNEDAVNSNPPSPFIAFEQNLNKKQSQDNTSTVPDLLL